MKRGLGAVLRSQFSIPTVGPLAVLSRASMATLLSGLVAGVNVPRIEQPSMATITTDFSGKVSGSTVECPHIARYAQNTQLQSPGAGAEISSASYTNIATLNATSYSPNTNTNGQYAQMLFSINLIRKIELQYGKIPGVTTADKVAWLKANLASLTVKWYGYGSSVGGNKAYLARWNSVGSAWNGTISNTASSPTLLSIAGIMDAQLTQGIDTNGFFHFICFSDPSDGVTASTINTDYVSLDIQFKSGVQLYNPSVMVEEGTTNLLTVNQRSFEIDNSGYAQYGGGTVQLQRDNTAFVVGQNSLKVITDGSAPWQGFWTSPTFTATAGNPHTFSVYLKGSGTVILQMRCRDSGGVLIGGALQSSPITLTTTWTRYSFAFTTVAGTNYADVEIITNSAQAVTFWVDGLQVEQKAYATSFIDGTRANEVLSIPTAGILSPAQGTIHQWVYVDSRARRQVAGQNNLLIYIPKNVGTVNYEGIILMHRSDTANWLLRTRQDDGTLSDSSLIPDTNTPDGWHLFTIKWSATEAKIFINGVLLGTIANPKLPSAFGSSITLGATGGSNYLNVPFGQTLMSNDSQSDATIPSIFNSSLPLDKQGIPNVTAVISPRIRTKQNPN